MNNYKKLLQKEEFVDSYIEFLNNSKTEREFITNAVKLLEEYDYKNIENLSILASGDRCYYINKNKSIYIANIGNLGLDNGVNIVAGHIDSPRLDLKPNPLYEKDNFAYFKTHYYGGIKKYQWMCIPLSIHGVIGKTNGEIININIGEDDDFVFTITDLLPHLAKNQLEKKASEFIEGETLNILLGSKDITDNLKIKDKILNILKEKYNILEDDFLSSELEVVPAFKAKSLGLDRSMILGYGQDDKVCSYAALSSIILDMDNKNSSICMLVDKEEIGSAGNSSASSQGFEYFMECLQEKTNCKKSLNYIFNKSKVLSADVDASYDPNFSEAYEKSNNSELGKGISINKYTGARGKSGANDANCEFVAYIRGLFNSNNIKYQITEMGKIDQGGGGTISYIFSRKGMDVIDCGVPVMSMHAPYEVTSKNDIYEAYKAYAKFYKN